jgi:hypothetical protein
MVVSVNVANNAAPLRAIGYGTTETQGDESK